MIVRWLTVNILTIALIMLWSFYQGFESNYILIGKLLAQAAFTLFLINLNMYFVFLLIRKSKVRELKIQLARISKQLMKYHIPIATTATILIILHGAIMLYVHELNFKIASGILSVCGLIFLLFSGLLRRKKATGRRRKFHYKTAFLFFAFVLFHIFV